MYTLPELENACKITARFEQQYRDAKKQRVYWRNVMKAAKSDAEYEAAHEQLLYYRERTQVFLRNLNRWREMQRHIATNVELNI